MMQSEKLVNNNKLPAIPLPVGVSPEEISKVVFSVLYHRALVETDRWAHWVLLAAIEILESNTAPPLDVNSLCKLRCLSEEDCSTKSNCQDLKVPLVEIKHEIVKVEKEHKKDRKSSSESDFKEYHRSGSVDNLNKYRTSTPKAERQMHIEYKRSSSRTERHKHSEYKTSSSKSERHKHSEYKASSSKSERHKHSEYEASSSRSERHQHSEHKTKDVSKKRRHSSASDKESTPRKRERSSSYKREEDSCIAMQDVTKEKKHSVPNAGKRPTTDVGIQVQVPQNNFGCHVSPRALGFVHSKWTQMWKAKPVQTSSQTEEVCQQNKDLVLHAEAQTDVTGNTVKLLLEQKETTEKGLQAVICCSDQESQTIIVHHKHASSQATSWRLIHVSGLPKRNRLESGSASSEGDILVDSDIGKFTSDEDVSVTVSKRKQSEGSNVKMNGSGSSGKLLKQNRIFHGKQLIYSKSDIDPPFIPETPIDSYMLLDPRCSKVC